MDIYLPAGRTQSNTGLVVLIHGGGWSGGDKSDFQLNAETIQILKEQFPGFALFNLNYRLATANSNHYPATELDIEAAMVHIWNHLGEYHLSNKTYILGGSAGGTLAALETLKHNTKGYIKGCISISGAYNLVSAYNQAVPETKLYLQAFMGGTPIDKPSEYVAASPINFITTSSPKFLILHGLEDNIIPVAQASEFKSALEAKNIPVTYFTYTGGHGIPPEYLEELLIRFKGFIK